MTALTISRIDRQDWRQLAACSSSDPEMFFIGSDRADRQAKAVCAGCPVRARCLAAQLEWEAPRPVTSKLHGVFGGLTGKERAEILAAEREVAA